ncbi:MAG: hypothetical protein INR62_07870 [Rhodospirillales bacterium]|nr:hypothetical protein [Acetobacter sp.]
MPQAAPPSRSRSNPLRYCLLALLTVALLGAMIGTRSWPLVGDAGLMHYVVFLLKAGAVPYRQVIDINLPGTYFFEQTGIALFGAGPHGLRLYDSFLLGSVLLASLGLAGRRHWFAACFSGLLFALVHLQDGLEQQGQRDLLLAVLLLSGLGAFRLLLESAGHRPLAAFLFGLAFGASFTIKPVFLPLTIALLLLGFAKGPLRSALSLALATTGLLAPGTLALCWLSRKGALRSFFAIAHSLMPLHATLGRRSLPFLLAHSFSPLGLLLVVCLLLPVLSRKSLLDHKLILAAGLAGALLAYLLQGKGYPYQRYPFLVILLVAMGTTLNTALDEPGPVRSLALVTLCCAGGLGLFFAWRSTTYDIETPTETALSRQLAAFGSPSQLTGTVQCLDTFGGCLTSLYDLGIRQSTGFLYDCYLFNGAGPERDSYRSQFWAAFHQAKPRLVVLSSQNCFKDYNGGYGRITSWPALADELHAHYREVTTWSPTRPVAWFSRKRMPFGFKLLLRDR